MIRKILFVMLSSLSFAGCASLMPTNQVGIVDDTDLPEPSLEKIAAGVWIHKSYKIIDPWGPILSQGMVIKTEAGVFLIDTAWDDADTEILLALIEAETGALPKAAIVTHAHQDKMGGMGAMHARQPPVSTAAHWLTNQDAPTRNLSGAFLSMLGNSESGSYYVTNYHTGGELEIFYPGPGHTRDNIVVYYDPAKILFGGCLIRPGGSSNLGNTADADIVNWASAVRKVAAEFPDAEIIIPSHGPMGGRELFDHTIALADAANE